jgi:DNA-directed RNA polymerase subunit RPC12/RpoP
VRLVIAVLMGLVIAGVGFSTLRGLARPVPPSPKPEEAQPMLHIARVTFWCSNCGTELLLLRKGTDAVPRHCGEKMERREEVARS